MSNTVSRQALTKRESFLSGGAASSVATLGISLAGGYVLDWVVGELLKVFADYDPVRDIAVKVCEGLDLLKVRLHGSMLAAVTCTQFKWMQEDLYGRPDYPEAEIKAELAEGINSLEKNHDLGLCFQLTEYLRVRDTLMLRTLAQYFFKEDAEHSGIGRFWVPSQRPTPTELRGQILLKRQELQGVQP